MGLREHADTLYRLVVDEGMTMADAGRLYGVSRERVRQILNDAYPDRPPGEVLRQRESVRRREEADLERLMERARLAVAEDRRCKICGAWILWGNRKDMVTCCTEHSKVWKALRRKLDDDAYESHRRSRARWALAHPDKVDASEVRSARLVLAGKSTPNRRFMHPNSKTRELLATIK